MNHDVACTQLGEFLRLLRARRAHRDDAGRSAGDDDQSLVLASALLRRSALIGDTRRLPLQLAVIGPTQSGKSTLVNLLLESEAAEASPLAGFTRHPQGFTCQPLDEAQERDLETVLDGWERLPAGETASGLSFSLVQVERQQALTERQLVVWDTPDFDSINSRDYRDLVPVICALADLVLMVVSREKYADQSVWRVLRLIEPVGIPLAVCINKVGTGEEALLRESMEQRLREESIHCERILSLPYARGGTLEANNSDAADAVRAGVGELLDEERDAQSLRHLVQFLEQHWAAWTEPLQHELAAGEQWHSMVERGLQDAIRIYRADYQQNPHFSGTLNRAVMRLLELLEIPGLAAGLTRARQLLTWPARKIRSLYREQMAPGREASPGAEAQILADTVDHLLLGLRNDSGELLAAAGDGSRWWRALLQAFDVQEQSLKLAARERVDAYLTSFEAEVRAAGDRLYLHLQAHPVTLNGLRAARATTDAAAVALAVKSGGIGLHDLILTPAMLSVTSMLAEGAMGGYMKQVERELQEKQLSMLRDMLFDGLLHDRLLSLSRELDCPGCLGISAERLQQAELALRVIR